MRVPGRKIYRAFGELDGFGDEQCARFVKGANRGVVRGVGRVVFLWMLGVGALVLALYGLEKLTGNWDIRLGRGVVYFAALFPIWTVGIFLSVLLVMVTRDWMLIRRIRWVLRNRGECVACRYSLLGLSVDDEYVVTCPECGVGTRVDESLGELVRDGAGRARFEPKFGAMIEVTPFWTAARRKWFVRGLEVAFVLFVVLPAAVIGVRELRIRSDAAVARADRARLVREWEALIESAQPPGRAGDVDGWTIFEMIAQRHKDATKDAANRSGTYPQVTYPDFYAVCHPPVAPKATALMPVLPQQEEEYAKEVRARELAIRQIDLYRSTDLYFLMDEFAKTGRMVACVLPAPGQPIVGVVNLYNSECREISYVNCARMRLARERGDAAEFVRAAEANFAIARGLAGIPFVVARRASSEIAHETIGECRGWFAEGAPRGLAAAIQGAMERQPRPENSSFAADGEGLMMQDLMAWIFSEPARVRLGMWGSDIRAYTDGMPKNIAPSTVLIGSYAANRDAQDAMLKVLWAEAEVEPWEWRNAKLKPSGFLLVDAFMPNHGNGTLDQDRLMLSTRGFVQMLRIERFRDEWGRYPSVEEFEDGRAGVLERDPMTGDPFVYAILEAACPEISEAAVLDTGVRDLFNRGGYVLYSPDSDGVRDCELWGELVLRPVETIRRGRTMNGRDVLLTPTRRDLK